MHPPFYVRLALPRELAYSRAFTTIRRSLSTSYVEGSLDPPLRTETLSEYFAREVLAKHSSRPALICRKELPRAHGGPVSPNLGRTRHLSWNFEEFDHHINALTRGLVGMGVVKGDRVGVLMGNNSSYAMLQWACARIGAILVTINPAYRIGELVGYLFHDLFLYLTCIDLNIKISRRETPFHRPQNSDFFLRGHVGAPVSRLRNSQPGDIQEAALPELRNLVIIDNGQEFTQELDRLNLKSSIDWREVMIWQEGSKEKSIIQNISATHHKDDVINLQFTSGTTGAPKAVSLTHSNLLNNALSIARCMSLSEKDVLCNVPPLFHCFDNSHYSGLRLVLGNLAAWSHGACVVYPSEIFDPPSIVDAVAEEQCTALHGVPTHFLGVLAEVQKRREAGESVDFGHLRTGIAAGSPIPIELMKKLISKLNLVGLTNAYGMTETSPVAFQTTPADPIEKRVETVGRVQPHVRAKLLDPDGNVVPIGTPGEICIAGYLLQKGYWQDEEQTRSVMKKDGDGTLWMHTGDEGIMDEEGYLQIVGRRKDIIIRGGENLFPVQIENCLTSHQDIREAAVISVPDEKYGEVVGAWIVRQPGTSITGEEVRRVVSTGMNPQNAPAWVWVVGEADMPAELPKTASGKVMKHVLRGWGKDLAQKRVGYVAGKCCKWDCTAWPERVCARSQATAPQVLLSFPPLFSPFARAELEVFVE
ncbi:hypothetical protein BD779DRAFT_1786507, partial [Infundibulicybe gibba]